MAPERLTADAVVIGLGPGGEEVAGRLAEAGLDVIGIESRLVGGECPYWGCVPSKMMIRAAGVLAEGRRIPGLAGRSSVEPDWTPVARRIRDEATDSWDDQVAVERLEAKGGRFLRGHGRITAPGTVSVTVVAPVTHAGRAPATGSAATTGSEPDTQPTHVIEVSKAIVINTGTAPAIPPVPGLDSVSYWTNREAIETEEVPASLIVMGGGAIGLELAQVFARFGSSVTVVEAAPRLLSLEEPESSELITKVLRDEGLRIHDGVGVAEVRPATGAPRRDGAHNDGAAPTGAAGAPNDGAITVRLDDGTELTADRLLVATGRRTDLAAIGVDTVGIDPNQRNIPVDEHLRAADGVWAIGDITGKGAFTHVSMYQASIAVADILGHPGPGADYKALPRVTFTDPEVGSVGITEETARQQGIEVRTGTAELPSSSRGWIHKVGNDGLIKLVEDARRGVLVGATSIGPSGGEVLGLLALAVHAEVPTTQLRQMIFAYPTFHRAIESALSDLAAH